MHIIRLVGSHWKEGAARERERKIQDWSRSTSILTLSDLQEWRRGKYGVDIYYTCKHTSLRTHTNITRSQWRRHTHSLTQTDFWVMMKLHIHSPLQHFLTLSHYIQVVALWWQILCLSTLWTVTPVIKVIKVLCSDWLQKEAGLVYSFK